MRRGASLASGSTLGTLLRLALPIVAVQVGMMLMGVVDTVMVGHVSTVDLAAVALGNLYFFNVSIFGVGVLMVVDPLVAQGVGAGDHTAVSRGVQRGLVLAGILALFSSALLVPGDLILGWFRQPPEVVPVAAAYDRALIPGVLAFFVGVVFRQSLQAMGRVAPVVITMVAANVGNVLLNWVLVFGNLGFPAMGAVGSGWATSLSRWLLVVALLGLAWRQMRPVLTPPRRDALYLPALVRMLRLGVPIGVQHELEFGAFGATALLMGLLGTVEMAAHQVAITLASLTFMVPLGIGAAAAVQVGQAIGRGKAYDARRAGRVALALGAAIMLVSAATMLALPHPLARLYTSDPGVIRLAAMLIPIAGLFQVFDGTQVVAAGVLRGIGDTRAPMVVSLIGFWMIGLPVSIFLGFRTGAGPIGLWWGLVAGLGAVAVFLLARVRSRLRRDLERVMIDEPMSAA